MFVVSTILKMRGLKKRDRGNIKREVNGDVDVPLTGCSVRKS